MGRASTDVVLCTLSCVHGRASFGNHAWGVGLAEMDAFLLFKSCSLVNPGAVYAVAWRLLALAQIFRAGLCISCCGKQCAPILADT